MVVLKLCRQRTLAALQLGAALGQHLKPLAAQRLGHSVHLEDPEVVLDRLL